MKRLIYSALTIIMAAGMGFAAAGSQTFTGKISDSMCGAKHMMAGKSDKDCTTECVKMGAKYVLATQNGKVYDLSNQKEPEKYAGEQVKVTGKLKGNTIEVSSIQSAK